MNAFEVDNSDVQVSAMALNPEGIGFPNDGGDVLNEYLFDGGATDSVSNDINMLTNYQPFTIPIPIQTAANDSSAVIIGKGKLEVVTEDNKLEKIDDVYYCPKATATIISPGALIAKGAKISMDEKHGYSITLQSGKVIRVYHKNKRWFINPRKKLSPTCNTPCLFLCATKNAKDLSRLWHNRFGHVSMRPIQKLFKNGSKYGLPSKNPCDEVVCEDCLKCKRTRHRTLGPTNWEQQLLDVVVSDVAGPFSACVSGEKLIVTF